MKETSKCIVHCMLTIMKIILIGWLMFLQIGKFNFTFILLIKLVTHALKDFL